MSSPAPREYHAPVWNEPVIMELSHAGRRGQLFPPPEKEVTALVGPPEELVPRAMRRNDMPALPELTEPEVQRHYLKLSQQTLGMVNISLFGTCTMKYNPRVCEEAARQLRPVHPLQPAPPILVAASFPRCPPKWLYLPTR